MLVSQAPVKFLSSPDLFTSPYTRKALRVPQITQSEVLPIENPFFLLPQSFPLCSNPFKQSLLA